MISSDSEDRDNAVSRRSVSRRSRSRSRAAIEEAGADDEGDDREEEDEAKELKITRRSSGYKSEEASFRPVGDLAPQLIKWLLEEERSLLTKIDQSIAEN